MFTITHGQPAEHQVWIMAGIIAFLIAAPIIIGSACLLGWLQGWWAHQERIMKNDMTMTQNPNELDHVISTKYIPTSAQSAELLRETAA